LVVSYLSVVLPRVTNQLVDVQYSLVYCLLSWLAYPRLSHVEKAFSNPWLFSLCPESYESGKVTNLFAEHNPDVMNALAKKLGLSDSLCFCDVYSLDEPSLLVHICRPVYALLAIIPKASAWQRDRESEASYSWGWTS
jgi:Ubiquitin carboxyl-terminal hydrolase, family 1.